MRRLIPFSLICILLLLPIGAQAAEIDLTLDEAIALALRDNRDILLKTEDVRKAKLKIKEARAGLFPSISFTGGWSDTRGYYEKDTGVTSTQTTLKQYVYRGGRTINTIKYNGYNFEIAEALFDKAKQDIMLSAKKAFYTLVLAQGLVNLNKGILDNTGEHVVLVEALYKNGQASGSDLLNIKASLDNVRQAYEASLSDAEAGNAILGNLLYLDRDIRVRPKTALSFESRDVAYDEAFLKAMQNRPEIRQYEAQRRAAEASVEVARADSRPSISASWDYYSRSHLAVGTTKNWNDYNVVGLNLSWPIFDGWATKAKVAQALVDLKEAQLYKEKAITDIALELKQAYLDLKDAIGKIKATESERAAYKDNLSVIKTKQASGSASSLELDDARLRYDISEFNHAQAIYDYLVARANFEKATGGL